MIRGILFDKDGTLLDFHATWMPAYYAAAEAVSRGAGRPGLRDRLLEAGGYDAASGRCDPGSPLGSGGNTDIARLWAGECGCSDVARVTDQIEAIFAREVVASAAAVGDLPPLLARLRLRGLHLGVATMDSESLAHETLSRIAVDDHLSFVCGYDSGHGKGRCW